MIVAIPKLLTDNCVQKRRLKAFSSLRNLAVSLKVLCLQCNFFRTIQYSINQLFSRKVFETLDHRKYTVQEFYSQVRKQFAAQEVAGLGLDNIFHLYAHWLINFKSLFSSISECAQFVALEKRDVSPAIILHSEVTPSVK